MQHAVIHFCTTPLGRTGKNRQINAASTRNATSLSFCSYLRCCNRRQFAPLIASHVPKRLTLMRENISHESQPNTFPKIGECAGFWAYHGFSLLLLWYPLNKSESIPVLRYVAPLNSAPGKKKLGREKSPALPLYLCPSGSSLFPSPHTQAPTVIFEPRMLQYTCLKVCCALFPKSPK